MNKGLKKSESLERLDAVFLRNLASELNGEYFGSYRDYSDFTKEELIDLLSGKLTSDEVQLVKSRYLLCHQPNEVAKEIKPDEVSDIIPAIEEYFDCRGLYEVKIGDRYCDLVFPDELTAVEIKSARDKIERATSQSEDYSKWSDNVYVAFDSSIEHKIPDEIENNEVGLLRYSEGEVELVKSPKLSEPDKSNLLESMTKEYLKNIAKSNGVSSTGNKDQLVSRLDNNITKGEVRKYFKDFLRARK